MKLSLVKVGAHEAALIHAIQVQCFMALYEKYHDDDTNPAVQSLEHLRAVLERPNVDQYLIDERGITVGMVRVVKRDSGVLYLGPLGILPLNQGRGLARRIVPLVEQLYPAGSLWELNSIAEEEYLCRLYEGLGYSLTGELRTVSPSMTLVNYQKRC